MPKRGADDQHDAAVALVRLAGDQRMHRRGEAERAGVGRHVVDAAVGDQDGAGDAVGRHVGRAPRRAPRTAACRRSRRRPGRPRRCAPRGRGCAAAAATSGRARGLALRGAVAEILARALVDDHDGDRGQRLAVLAGERRIGERQRPAAPARRRAAPRRGCGRRTAAARSRPRARPRPTALPAAPAARMRDRNPNQRSYCPSRSSSAGMCTWSAL